MFAIGFGAFCAYAGISFVLWAMEDAGLSRGLVEGAAWVGYGGLALGFLAGIIMAFI